jgi:YD repeat-containing protein
LGVVSSLIGFCGKIWRERATPQYNGNIAQIEWQVAGREGQAYAFQYDGLDRLTDAVYSDRRKALNSNTMPIHRIINLENK